MHAAVVEHRPEAAGAAFSQGEPYCIALIDLEEGVRMMTNIVGCPQTPQALQLDMPVEVKFEDFGKITLPLFKPAGA